MMTVREAFANWHNVLSSLPGGMLVDTTEEGATPGPGVSFAVSSVMWPNGRVTALAVGAGTYDGSPRVHAEFFDGLAAQVVAAVEEFRMGLK